MHLLSHCTLSGKRSFLARAGPLRFHDISRLQGAAALFVRTIRPPTNRIRHYKTVQAPFSHSSKQPIHLSFTTCRVGKGHAQRSARGHQPWQCRPASRRQTILAERQLPTTSESERQTVDLAEVACTFAIASGQRLQHRKAPPSSFRAASRRTERSPVPRYAAASQRRVGQSARSSLPRSHDDIQKTAASQGRLAGGGKCQIVRAPA